MQTDEPSNHTMQSSAEVIKQVLHNVETLNDVLEREYQALMDRDIVLINTLASEKEGLLNSLAHLEPHLRAVYNAVEMQEDEHSVQQLLQLCRDLNTRNQSLALVAIDQNKKSLSLLRNVLKLDQSSEYSPSGELNADNSKRYLGNA